MMKNDIYIDFFIIFIIYEYIIYSCVCVAN